MIPYGKQTIEKDDIDAVIDILQSDWVTTGPTIDAFERAVAHYVGAEHAVAVNSGTAALHCAVFAADIKPGDEVIIPPITFAATANSVLYQRAKPVFADVLPDTLLINPEEIERKITHRTKAVVAVDYAGQPCAYDEIRQICKTKNLVFISDACHALGAKYKGQKVGGLADLTTFSFHPVKHITTGEGGMVVTSNEAFARRARQFRNHGITTDQRSRTGKAVFQFEMTELGFNYRITDFQCALGLSQLKKLETWIKRRQDIARRYIKAFEEIRQAKPLKVNPETFHAYHLFVIQLANNLNRDEVFNQLRERGIGVNVHYIPVYYHPYYRKLGYKEGECPVAEAAYQNILSLPMFHGLSDDDLQTVLNQVRVVLRES